MNKKEWYKRWWGIVLIIFLTLFLSFSFAFSLAVLNILKNDEIKTKGDDVSKENEISKEKLKLIEGNENNYWLGSGNPKITIVEFADFTCPYCKKSFPKIREISKKYEDIKIIYRDLPIMKDYSTDLSLAARCAGEQGLFWLMHDKLFINQGVKEKDKIFNLAKEIGVNENRFKSCYESKKYIKDIQKDYNDAAELGVNNGTPIWFINGHQVSGDIPRDTFMEIIEKMLEEKS